MSSTQAQNLVVHGGAIVEATTTVLKGHIEIGKGTVVHPNVQILAENGRILIGKNNLIEEGVVLCNKSEKTMVIGDDNVFEIRARSESLSIGNNNLLQMKAHIGINTTLANGCVVGINTDIDERDVEDLHHVYNINGQIVTRTAQDLPPTQTQQLEYLRSTIPNYHKIKRPNAP